MSIKPVRRHTPKCPHRDKGENFLRCRCPIYAKGSEFGRPQICKSLKTRDLARAESRLRELLDDFVTNRKKVSEACLSFLAAQEWAEGTRRNNTRILREFQSFCEGQSLPYVHLVSVEDIYLYRRSRPIAARTWIKELEGLRHFFRYCVDLGWTKTNPAKTVKSPKAKPKKVVPYTDTEVIAILAACDRIGRGAYERQRARCIIMLMRYCGLSVVDVATLRRDEVNDGMMHRSRQKTGETVLLALPDTLTAALDSLPLPRGAAGEAEFYFWSGNGSIRSAQRDITRTVGQVFKQSGVPNAHAHKFRHTLATELLGAGASYEEVAAILGSSPAIIREHYAQWSVKRQERTTNLLQTVHKGTILGQARDEDQKLNNDSSLSGGRHGVRISKPH